MVSVIIPTYNNEDTIERAIFSVVSQTYIDWELVLINDCSTDKTREICERYAAKYANISLINNEENMGVGVARQVALKAAKGEFVTFLDSDDFIVADFLQKSMMLQAQSDSDVVYTSYIIFYPQDGIKQILKAGDYLFEGEATPQLHFIQEKKFLTGKIFRKSLLEQIPWSNKRVGEDVQTLFFATYQANKVRSSSYSGYVHCFREGSLLANTPYFYAYCESTITEQEIIDYLIEKQDERLWRYLLTTNLVNHNTMLSALDTFSKKDRTKYRSKWKQLTKWYTTHDKYIKALDNGNKEIR
ncbi:MAG: glycosyltransferase family 2 protein [Bacteroidales bacterium]|nr:glycosyltransferase family 2 protein [Candidatus Colicola equi]